MNNDPVLYLVQMIGDEISQGIWVEGAASCQIGLRRAERGRKASDRQKSTENRLIKLTAEVVKSAGDLAEKRGLRGFDALHLASALELQRAVSDPVNFSTSDAKLRESARAEGLP